MKWMFASDIHGSAKYCKMMLDRLEKENADRLVVLGDLLYHGPRNDLPEEYNPKAVIEMLNSVSDKLLTVRGNCDAEVDQMVLNFPMMAEYIILDLGEKLVYVTHGHVFNENNLFNGLNGNILMNGHTHVPALNKHDGYVYMNPGSVSLPKNDSCHSYMTFENNLFQWKNLVTGEVYKTTACVN